MSAASQARKRRDADDLQIVAFERGRATSYSRLRHPVLDRRRRRRGGRARRTHAGAAPPQRRRRADAHRGHRDRPRGTHGDGARPRDRPVLRRAVGLAGRTRPAACRCARARRASTPPACTACRPSTTAASSSPRSTAATVERVVVVGGGYIGLEIAEACQVRGLDVTVVDRSATPVGTFDPDIGAFIADAVRGARASGWCSARRWPGSRPAPTAAPAPSSPRAARRLPADLVVLGLGVRPERRARAGRRHPARRRPAASRSTRGCARPCRGVWAAGDCVESVHRLSGQRIVVALGTHANKQGRVVGHQPRRRLRDLPRRDRHRRHQGVRPRGRSHRAVGGGGRRPPATATSPRTSTRRRAPATSRAPSRSGSSCSPRSAAGACSAPRSSGARARPSASTCWPPRCGTR